MDDDQFQGGLSGQGGNPVPANNSNTYDFTNGDPLANLDNPEATAAEADPADGIAVDPLANEPIMDLTNNVNISAPEAPVEPEATAPAEREYRRILRRCLPTASMVCRLLPHLRRRILPVLRR